MRDDMAKLLVERPRTGGGVRYPRGASYGRIRLDEQPGREPVKYRWQRLNWHCRKRLNENLAPLRRFLRSRLGRPWDVVYGEICQRINRDSAVQLHIWQHLMWDVCRDPVEVEKGMRSRFRFGSGFYVDPETRLLMEWAREWPAEPRTRPMPFLVPHDGRWFKRVDGLWFEVMLAPLPNAGPFWDALLSRAAVPWPRAINRHELEGRYQRGMYAGRKRQLNKKEIARLRAALTRDG